MAIVGGTGAFAGATGGIVAPGQLDFATGTQWAGILARFATGREN